MLEYNIRAIRQNESASVAIVRNAEVELDTSLAGRADALNPAELLLAALAACMIKGIERAAPMLKFEFRSVAARVHGVRQDVPPKLISIEYELTVDTDESDHRLELLLTNVRKYGTISNTIAEAVTLTGTIKRAV